jgi:hypothetical protein
MEEAMTEQIDITAGAVMFAEIQEFGSFSVDVQRYIGRSLDIAFYPDVPPAAWARDARETDDIHAQKQVYNLLHDIRAAMPKDHAYVDPEAFLFPLMGVTAFDVTCSPIISFGQYRFLYERLLGAAVRPWLPGAFASAAALPHFPSDVREVLLASTTNALTDEWSMVEPSFYPQWLGELDPVQA